MYMGTEITEILENSMNLVEELTVIDQGQMLGN